MIADSITCVVPTLQSASTLEATLLSLEAQPGVMVKAIVADSASKDGTLEICRRRGLHVLQVEAGNMYRAINAALRSADTEWLAYLNSDDWLYPGSLARLIAKGRETAAAVVYGNCDYADGQGRFVYSFAAATPRQLLPLFRLGRMGFAQPAAIFRADLYQALDGFDEAFRFKADADFYIRALQAGARFAYCDGTPVACFRLHARQLSNARKGEIEREGMRLFGRPALRPHRTDWAMLLQWRLQNLPHYAIRIVRESLLSRRIRLPQSVETYVHE